VTQQSPKVSVSKMEKRTKKKDTRKNHSLQVSKKEHTKRGTKKAKAKEWDHKANFACETRKGQSLIVLGKRARVEGGRVGKRGSRGFAKVCNSL